MKTSDEITVEVNGQRYGGWLSAQVVSSLDQAATQFALGVTEEYPGGSIRIKAGDSVVVRIGSDIVTCGYVDKAPVSFSASEVTHSVSGRSKIADLIDSCVETALEDKVVTHTTGGTKSASPARYAGVQYKANGEKLANAPVVTAPVKTTSEYHRIDIRESIAALIKPYGIRLRADGVNFIHSKKISVSVGTKVFDAVRELIKKSNLTATDDEYGDLVLWSVDRAERAADDLIAERSGNRTNVLTGSCEFDYSDIYSEYKVFGQSVTKATKNPAASYNINSIPVTSTLLGNRRRVLRIFQSGQIDQSIADKKARFERDHREALALAATYQVAGWRQSDGSLWRKGLLVHVADEIMGIDADMVVQKVTYSLSDAGTICSLDVVPPAAFGESE